MKKLVLGMIVFTLTIFTSCSNSNDEIPTLKDSNNKTEQFQNNKKSDSEAKTLDQVNAETSVNALKIMRESDMTGKPPLDPITPNIICHTPYYHDVGNACIQSGGFLFNVRCIGGYYPIEGGWIYQIAYYPGDPVSTCNCQQ